jgi:phospholipid/cholesterol/gamma-HCH transport system substrate-binding protein
MWMRADVPLYSDFTVAVEMEELMGGRQIVIDPGTSGRPADPNKPVKGTSQGDAMELIVRADEVLSRADTLFQQVSALLDTDRFSRVFKNLEETTGQAKTMLAENRRGLRLTVDRLEAMTRSLHEDSTAVRLGTVVARLDTTAGLMRQVARRMNREDGTMGRLMKDRDLYDQLLKTTTDLDSLITDIKTNPKKYIHVSVF